jgi:predicted O-linked N-acetylglucosamine transferase (SPINDLY family)
MTSKRLPRPSLDLARRYRGEGQRDAAANVCRALLEQGANQPEVLSFLGNLELERGRPADAVPLLERAVALSPESVARLVNLGLAYGQSGALAEAADTLERALRMQPDLPEASLNLGLVRLDLGEHAAAIALITRAVASRPGFLPATRALAKAWARQGEAQARRGDLTTAITSFGKSIGLDPSVGRVQRSLGVAWLRLANLSEGLRCLERALSLDPTLADAEAKYVFHSAFSPGVGADELLRIARAYSDHHLRSLRERQRPHPHDRALERPLRVGYASADFREHTLRLFVLPVLRHHDRRRFEIHCYSSVKTPDAWTERLRELADRWHDVATLSDAELAEKIRSDQIDVLIDLSMYMDGHRRRTFAEKPAPVQITWFAYPGTTGAEGIDYRITDPLLDPPGAALPYSERSLWLPHSFWCYDPASEQPMVNDLPARARGRVTFGCLNNFLKVNRSVLELWGRVLTAVPDSELLLLAPSAWAREFARTELEKQGVNPKRVHCEGLKWRADYLELYHRIDVALDCFPYNGHTTSFDAFWMGVPVVTLVGNTIVGRAGLCQAHHLDLRELVAETPDEYLRIAVGLARDLPRLRALRSELRARLARSPLMDGQSFTRGLEQAYREAWQRFCEATEV